MGRALGPQGGSILDPNFSPQPLFSGWPLNCRLPWRGSSCAPPRLESGSARGDGEVGGPHWWRGWCFWLRGSCPTLRTGCSCHLEVIGHGEPLSWSPRGCLRAMQHRVQGNRGVGRAPLFVVHPEEVLCLGLLAWRDRVGSRGLRWPGQILAQCRASRQGQQQQQEPPGGAMPETRGHGPLRGWVLALHFRSSLDKPTAGWRPPAGSQRRLASFK